MGNVNKVILLGRLGADPETGVTSVQQIPTATLRVATNSRFKNQSGDWEDRPSWHRCVAFGRTAEILAERFKKGSQIYLEGRLETRSWDDESSGQKRYMTEVIINNFEFIDPKSGGTNQSIGDGIDLPDFDIDDSSNGGDIPF
mgnify:CR=1 FL=1